MQLSSPRGLESCNSQVPGDLRVATRVVKTQTSIIRFRGSLSFCRFRAIHCVCSVVCIGFRRPGLLHQVPGGLTVATQWQLSSPRGLESCNSQVPGDLRVATLKSPGTSELQHGSSKPNEHRWKERVLEILPISHVSLCFPIVFARFRRPGHTRAATMKSPGA